MIRITYGDKVIEIPESLFPVKVETEQEWGNQKYKLYLNFLYTKVNDKEVKLVKSMNLSK